MKTMNYSLIRILFALVIGLVLVLWPNTAASYIVITVGVAFLIPGVISLFGYFGRKKSEDGVSPRFPIEGVGSLLFGLWLIVMPEFFADVLMFLLGFILIMGNLYRYDLIALLMHAEHLEATYGCGPHTISVPRICPADDIDPATFSNAVPDDVFLKVVALIRLSVPYTGMIMSTRESARIRTEALKLGVSQISGGSRTSVGGYTIKDITKIENTAQFDTSDRRSLDEVVHWLLDNHYLPSFCTACYRAGRTGDRFMEFAKDGSIARYCQANAVMTMKEYLCDYASPATKEAGERVIANEIPKICHEKMRIACEKRIIRIEEGERDFRF